MDPVFVDTSEGKAVIADSLKTTQTKNLNEVKSKADAETSTEKPKPEKTKPVKEIKEESEEEEEDEADSEEDSSEEGEDEEEETAKPPVEEKNTETKRGELFSCHVLNVVIPNTISNPFSTYLGLKAFMGLNHKDLFKSEGASQSNTVPPPSKVVAANIDEDSDSDSDYEYFKAQRIHELKNPKVEKEGDSEEDGSGDDGSDDDGEEDEAAPAVNTFAAAVKSAAAEDELVLPASVNQTFLIVPMKLRLVTLVGLIVEHCINNKKGGKMIVFVATLEMVDYLSELIETALTGKEVKKKKKNQDKGKAKKRKSGDDNDEDVSTAI